RGLTFGVQFWPLCCTTRMTGVAQDENLHSSTRSRSHADVHRMLVTAGAAANRGRTAAGVTTRQWSSGGSGAAALSTGAARLAVIGTTVGGPRLGAGADASSGAT